MNMTLDGFCDHTSMNADDEIHKHYAELLRQADLALYGRITYHLMEYWRSVAANPTGNKTTDDFAATMDAIPKIVYSRTLETVDWPGTELKREIIPAEILELKERSGKDILVGSPSLIVGLSNLGVVDEYQISIHPAIVGSGLRLFDNISERIDLDLLDTKTFECGATVHYYRQKRAETIWATGSK